MEAMNTWLQKFQGMQGPGAYALLFGLLVSAGVGAPVNEDILLIGAAALTFYSVFSAPALIAVGIVGVVLGDILIFHWGYRYGAALTRTRFFSKIVSEKKLIEFQARCSRGHGFLFVTRFLPGIRTPIFFAAGSLKIPYRRMAVLDFCAALIQVPILVYGVRYVGGNTDLILGYLERFQKVVLAVVVIGLVMYFIRRRRLSRSTQA